jgi:hypothetical protein
MPAYQTVIAVAIGIAFVLASFAIAGRIIPNTTTSPDVEIVKMRFAQVMFIRLTSTRNRVQTIPRVMRLRPINLCRILDSATPSPIRVSTLDADAILSVSR